MTISRLPARVGFEPLVSWKAPRVLVRATESVWEAESPYEMAPTTKWGSQPKLRESRDRPGIPLGLEGCRLADHLLWLPLKRPDGKCPKQEHRNKPALRRTGSKSLLLDGTHPRKKLGQKAQHTPRELPVHLADGLESLDRRTQDRLRHSLRRSTQRAEGLNDLVRLDCCARVAHPDATTFSLG